MVYSTLSRVAPGEMSAIAGTVGLSQDLINKFYDTKGNMTGWKETERMKFMSGILDMSVMYTIPDGATREEWTKARNMNRTLRDHVAKNFGDDIWDQIDIYYGLKGPKQSDRNAANDFLEANPMVEEAMDYQAQQINASPLLTSYYGGFDKIRGYYKGLMYDQIHEELGTEVHDTWKEYWAIKNTEEGKAESRAFWKEHPELARYSEITKSWNPAIDQKMAEIASRIPQGTHAQLREGVSEEQTETYEEAIEQMNPAFQMSQAQWNLALGTSIARTVLTGNVPVEAEEYLEYEAQRFGLTYEELLDAIQNAE
jgi:hypothetical protein